MELYDKDNSSTVICGAEVEKKESVNLSKIITQLTKSKGGLYPHEILMLNMVSRYKSNFKNNFEWFWKKDLGIDNPQMLIDKLINQGFVDIEDDKATISRLTIPEIKEFLKEYGCKLTGKKAELLDRLFAECDISDVGSKFTQRRYCLTDKGKEEIEREENEYVMFTFRKGYSISIYEMNIMLYQNNPLNLSYKELIWRRFLEESEDDLKNLYFGSYRNTRLNMSYFLRDENRDSERLYYLCEVVAYDLSGLPNSYYFDFSESAYAIERDIKNYFPYSEQSFIVIAPAIVDDIYALREKMKLEGLNFEEEVIKNLKEIKVYRSVFTPEERIEILFAELDEDIEKLEEIYSIAEKRMRDYSSKLNNGDEKTTIEYYSKLNNVDEETIREYFSELNDKAEKRLIIEESTKDIKENRWMLESNRDTYFEFNKNIIENEIDKVDRLESDWLVLQPPESIKGTIYLQICIEIIDGDYRKEGQNFHIELCFEDDEGNLTSFRKDNLTKAEVLKIFIDYFENKNLPNITNWYSVEL